MTGNLDKSEINHIRGKEIANVIYLNEPKRTWIDIKIIHSQTHWMPTLLLCLFF